MEENLVGKNKSIGKAEINSRGWRAGHPAEDRMRILPKKSHRGEILRIDREPDETLTPIRQSVPCSPRDTTAFCISARGDSVQTALEAALRGKRRDARDEQRDNYPKNEAFLPHR